MNFYELNEKIMNEPRMSARPGLSGGKTVRRKRKPGNRPGGRIDRSNLGYSRKKDRFDYQDLDVNEDSDKDWRVRGSNYDNPSRDQFPTMLNDVLDKKFSAVDKKIFNMIAYNNSGRMNDWWLEFKQDPIEWIMKKKEDWQARGLWNKTADLIQSEQRNEDHSEMSDDDYKITPSGHLGGKVSVSDSFGRPKEFQEVEDALDYIRKDMEKNHFWPNIWWISDHGNHWMIDLEGNEIKENADW
jgi:hypothetical protein